MHSSISQATSRSALGRSVEAGVTPLSADFAQAMLLRVRLQNWRIQLSLALMLTGMVAWIFDAYVQDQRLLAWTALAWLSFGLQAWLCAWMDRWPETVALPRWWWRTTLTLTAFLGVVWGSLPWLLPADVQSTQLLGAFGSLMVAFGVASGSSSRGMLMAPMIPIGVLVPSALAWRADLPWVAAGSLLALTAISRFGLSILRATTSSLQQQHRAEALTHSLQREQERVQAALQQQALLDERQRMMRDLHDGLGSTLVSTLVALERGTMAHEEVLGVLRECVDDLRTVIDSLEPIGHDLVLLLATVRHRLASRFQTAGLNLHWEVSEVPPLAWLGPSQALQVVRMVQEALANVLKHARAANVRIATRELGGQGHVSVIVEDDGVGFAADEVKEGRGLFHLRARARQLGAKVDIRSTLGRGTCIELQLPLGE